MLRPILGTAVWSFRSASLHRQLPEIICVPHSLLRDLRSVFTFTGADLIKSPQTNICFYFTASECCSWEQPRISIPLPYFAVLWASTWAQQVAIGQSWRRGQLPMCSPCPIQGSKTLTQSPTPVTWADTAWPGDTQPTTYCPWPAT